jgi:hypothetical protein
LVQQGARDAEVGRVTCQPENKSSHWSTDLSFECCASVHY